MLLSRLFFIEKHISFSCSTQIKFSKSLLLFFQSSVCVHCSWSIVSNLENDPASGYSLTPIIQIRIITPWISYTILLVMHLGMRLALSWFVIVLQWQNSIHSKLFTAVFLSRQLFPGLYSNIWFFCPQCNILFLLLLKFTLLITNHMSNLLRSVFNPVKGYTYLCPSSPWVILTVSAPSLAQSRVNMVLFQRNSIFLVFWGLISTSRYFV